MGSIRMNRAYHDPALGAAFSNIASLFGSPDASDVASYAAAEYNRARTESEKANAQRLADFYRMANDPTVSHESIDRGGIGAGVFTPVQSFYKVDSDSLTAQRGQDITARTSADNNVRDNARELEVGRGRNAASAIGALFGPLNPGQVRPSVPVEVMGTVGLPAVGEVQGAPKPPTEDEIKARVLSNLPDNEQRAAVLSGVRTENIQTPDGPRVAFSPDAVGHAPAPDASKGADIAGNMRKEIVALPSFRNYSQAAPIYATMLDTADRNSKASDLNLVYGLGKIFDPGSVVREGEMIMVRNTGALPDWLIGTINSLNGGAALTPETRAAIMREAQSRMESYRDLFKTDLDRYGGIADRAGISRADILPSISDVRPYSRQPDKPGADGSAPAPARPDGAAPAGNAAPVQITTQADYEALPSGTPFVAPDGTVRRKP